MQIFVDGFKARVGNLSSQPELVHELFSYLHLENSTTARAVVADLWDTPLDLEPMVDQIAKHRPRVSNGWPVGSVGPGYNCVWGSILGTTLYLPPLQYTTPAR